MTTTKTQRMKEATMTRHAYIVPSFDFQEHPWRFEFCDDSNIQRPVIDGDGYSYKTAAEAQKVAVETAREMGWEDGTYQISVDE